MKKIITVIAIIAIVSICALSMVACDITTTIGVQSGTTGYYYAKGDEDWGFDGFSNVTVSQYSNGGLAVLDLINSNIDYVIIDEAPAKILESKYDGIKVIDIALTEEEYAFGVDPAQADLLTSVNETLATLMSNGTYDAIIDTYFNDGTPMQIESAIYDANNQDGQLVVATNAAFDPFEYVDGTYYSGIDMELAYYIAEALELELVIMNMEFDSVVTSVGTNGIDIAMAGLTVTEKRKESVSFTDSYYNASQMLIVLEDDTSFDDCVTAADVEAIIAAL
ncbi:MAG: transporter substrate-binding domain-containing protein [Bacillota bacterium]